MISNVMGVKCDGGQIFIIDKLFFALISQDEKPGPQGIIIPRLINLPNFQIPDRCQGWQKYLQVLFLCLTQLAFN